MQQPLVEFRQVSDPELLAAVKAALKEAGVSSLAELRALADEGGLSDRARVAWVSLSALVFAGDTYAP